MVSRPSPFVVNAGHGDPIEGPVNGRALIKARTETTGGSFALLEIEVGPKQGPPLHHHLREDEMWFVLDGHFRFVADGAVLDAPTGSFVFVPKMSSHCFQNLGDQAARMLVMFTPSGMERFFEEHAAHPTGEISQSDYERIADNSWMVVDGPPLGISDPV